jgi:hypothetical protein
VVEAFFDSAIIGDMEEIRGFAKFMDVNRQDADGNTILHLAAQHNHKEMFEFLEKCLGCDLSITNKAGFTALELRKSVIKACDEGIEYPIYNVGYIASALNNENYLEEVKPVGVAENVHVDNSTEG